MPESAPDVVTYESLGADAWSPELRELLEAVADVASRLDHDVLSPEHLLVVGAENGTEAMARQVAATDRGHLLDGNAAPQPERRDSFLWSELGCFQERLAGRCEMVRGRPELCSHGCGVRSAHDRAHGLERQEPS